MKYLKYFSFIFIMCLLLGCGIKNNIVNNNQNNIHDNVSPIEGSQTAAKKAKEASLKSELDNYAKAHFTVTKEVKEISLESTDCDTKQAMTKNNYFISAHSKDGNIFLFDTITGKKLASFEESFGTGRLFLSMTDENNGVLLYCSSPGCGQMMKQLYSTKDRWQTSNKIDISSLIDGYPNSLLALSEMHFYIGAQMRSNGYLFETIDGGKTWQPVIIDPTIEKCRYGFAPIRNIENDIFYVLLECAGFYSLYQSDNTLSAWKLLGNFSSKLEIESCFIWEDKVIVTDTQGEHYQLVFRTHE